MDDGNDCTTDEEIFDQDGGAEQSNYIDIEENSQFVEQPSANVNSINSMSNFRLNMQQ